MKYKEEEKKTIRVHRKRQQRTITSIKSKTVLNHKSKLHGQSQKKRKIIMIL